MKTDSAPMGNMTTQREEKIIAEQIRLLFRQLLPSVIVNYITISIFTIVFKKDDDVVFFSIVALLSIASAIPLLLYWHYKRHEFNNKKVTKICQYHVVSLFFTALTWSLLFCWIYDHKAPQNAYFIMFSCIAFLVGSAPLLSNYFLSYLVYAPTFSMPLIITWVTSNNNQHQVIGILVFAILILMLLFSYWLNRTWRNSIALQFENLDLVESLQIQKNSADQANRAKSKFLAAASHDLRQPLHALSLFTAVLDESVEQPKNRKIVEQITMSVKALESLFNALLDISQLDAGVLTPEKTHVDLHPLLAKLANDHELQAHKKGVVLLFPDCSYALFTDENLLEQILRNYISNAIRYTNTGTVKVHCEVEESFVRINVTDTGVGISEYEQQAIFDEFYQLNNQERDRSKGLGLGLAIVQRTAHLLGHTINVRSTLGEGTTFSVSVEQSTEHITPAPQPLTTYNKNNQQTDTIKPVVLVIDNEESVRQGTQSLLEMWGCNVFSAADQKEALTILRQQRQIPDGIIADYRLSEQQTGVDAILAIQAEYNNEITALIVTGDIDPERLVDINKSGFQVLHKPVATLKLRTFIDHIRMQ